MSRRKQWEEFQVINGFSEIKIRSWRYFFNFVYEEMLDFQTYIWRGHRCDEWILESTLDRLRKKAKIAETKSYNFSEQHLEQFKHAVRGRRGANPPKLETENDWWALGQHYGLATPLLDWTTSPFVAAYFAFIGMGEKQTKYRAVYALHKPSIEEKVKELLALAEEERKKGKPAIESEKKITSMLKSYTACREPIIPAAIESGKKSMSMLGDRYISDIPIRPEVEFIRPLSDENQRLVNQGGLFTRFPADTDIQSWVQKKFKDDNKGCQLLKIHIPNKDREECLKSLNRMNINHLTLFPDLYGASRFCNLFGEIERY